MSEWWTFHSMTDGELFVPRVNDKHFVQCLMVNYLFHEWMMNISFDDWWWIICSMSEWTFRSMTDGELLVPCVNDKTFRSMPDGELFVPSVNDKHFIRWLMVNYLFHERMMNTSFDDWWWIICSMSEWWTFRSMTGGELSVLWVNEHFVQWLMVNYLFHAWMIKHFVQCLMVNYLFHEWMMNISFDDWWSITCFMSAWWTFRSMTGGELSVPWANDEHFVQWLVVNYLFHERMMNISFDDWWWIICSMSEWWTFHSMTDGQLLVSWAHDEHFVRWLVVNYLFHERMMNISFNDWWWTTCSMSAWWNISFDDWWWIICSMSEWWTFRSMTGGELSVLWVNEHFVQWLVVNYLFHEWMRNISFNDWWWIICSMSEWWTFRSMIDGELLVSWANDEHFVRWLVVNYLFHEWMMNISFHDWWWIILFHEWMMNISFDDWWWITC